jgi:2-(1,2-epoxy-1,2-dihydrophenyl)acetyl-CoA isomerase
MSEAASATVAGRVLQVRLVAPERSNSLDLDGTAAFAKALDQVGPGIGAISVLHDGANFCVGGDVRGFRDAVDPEKYLFDLDESAHVCIRLLTRADVPVVLGARGWAAGAGMALLLTPDILVLGESARMRVAYPAIGITPDCGTTWHLPRIVGAARAREILLTNRVVDAAEALAIGIASRVVPDDEVEPTVNQIAAELASGPTEAYRKIRRLLAESPRLTLDEQLNAEAFAISRSAGTPQGSEGIRAFLDKRPPVFHPDEPSE